MKNNLSIFNNLRPLTVGFDDMFAHFEHHDGRPFHRRTELSSNFPPYNIVKTGKNTYNIELALAGFNKKDIDVEYEDNNLSCQIQEADKAEASETTDDDGNMIHRGISKETCSLKSFTIASRC